ncbi:MAG: UPF0182 family protein [Deltaproteobacteria bacterium]|nr:MAG: UPF0182 family protein [Deltaproteobacteria bacterium]RLC14916.1 MAG: UPF0182 family protein [Deltaproteobacteria bacterium]
MQKKLIVIGIGIVGVLLLWIGTSIYPDWLWFENLGFSPVFWTMLMGKFGFGLMVWLLLTLIIGVNIYAANRLNPPVGTGGGFKIADNYVSQFGLSPAMLKTLVTAFILFLPIYIASKGSAQWDLLLRYLYQQPFGSTDPVFNRDLGFYLFSLPFYIFIQNGLLILFIVAVPATMAWYLKNGALKIEGDLDQAMGTQTALPKITLAENVKKHLIFLGGIIVLLLAWAYRLKMFGLLYSDQGPAFGASYTDVHIKILAYKVIVLVSIGFAIVLFINAFKIRTKLIWISAAIWIGVMLGLGTGVPMLAQKLIVKPNELAKEAPYIAYNIDFTRKAYNLNKIKVVNFEVKNELTAQDLKQHDVTIQNIRIWDERPLLQTYRQIQAIRLYYDFNNVDVDRYIVDGQYRQIMLAARELVVNKLPPQANTWVNRHLTYTHGYGLAASPVNEVTSEGLPRLFVKDLPPSFEPDLKVVRPEIYYGEKTDAYVLVKTEAQEFDYPKGDKNVYTTYQGTGGIHIKSFFRRLLFAIEFFDPQILFTTYLNPESRIMFNRRVYRRTNAIAPFLDYDGDPYLVVSNGKLYWIQDAYTTSAMYPYSQRSYGKFKKRRLNYIRNSVKVTIDAYNGDVAFYVIDEKDPIIKTYAQIFPDLFKPFKDMPAELKAHIRYPKDLFKIQMETYTKYHMEDVQVFYNQEDLWQIPDEVYGDRRQEMEPYYIILKLPEEQREEFFLMSPFTPSKKDNMIGWLAARCDLPNYGNLLVYKLPKEKLVYGPMQIEARVDQQTEISRELSLWGQRGSRVIRGNLLAIPVGETFIYVEPVYLEAIQEESQMSPTDTPQSGTAVKPQRASARVPRPEESRAASLPELKRVIVAFGNRLIMEETLDRALSRILDVEITPKQPASLVIPQIEGEGLSNLGVMALDHYTKAKTHLRNGDWTGYGRELENLEKILKELSGIEKTE